MPTLQPGGGRSRRTPHDGEMRSEFMAQVAVQTVKILPSYRMPYRSIVMGRSASEVTEALREARNARELPPDGVEGTLTDLASGLWRLASQNFLRCGPVNPLDAYDGMDGATLRNASLPAVVVVDDDEIQPGDLYLGPGSWRKVWINTDVPVSGIEVELRNLGFAKAKGRSEWDHRFGPGAGFMYLIGRRNGLPAPKAKDAAYPEGWEKARGNLSVAKALSLARKWLEWRRLQQAYEDRQFR